MEVKEQRFSRCYYSSVNNSNVKITNFNGFTSNTIRESYSKYKKDKRLMVCYCESSTN